MNNSTKGGTKKTEPSNALALFDNANSTTRFGLSKEDRYFWIASVTAVADDDRFFDSMYSDISYSDFLTRIGIGVPDQLKTWAEKQKLPLLQWVQMFSTSDYPTSIKDNPKFPVMSPIGDTAIVQTAIVKKMHLETAATQEKNPVIAEFRKISEVGETDYFRFGS